MSDVEDCPTCGGRCRVVRAPQNAERRLVALTDRQLVAKVEQLKGALARLRAAAKANPPEDEGR